MTKDQRRSGLAAFLFGNTRFAGREIAASETSVGEAFGQQTE